MDRRHSLENSTIGGDSSGAGNSSGNNHIPQQPAKSRGRPKGSKNKPRAVQPLVGRSLIKPMMMTIDIQAGSDIVQRLFQFCCHRNVLLSVLRGGGFLSDVILCGRRSTNAGPFLIESLFGTVRPVPPQSVERCCQLKVMLLEVEHSRLYGQLLRGEVIGGLVTVEVMMTELSKYSVRSVVTRDDVNNPLQIDHQESNLMMNSSRDDSMTIVTGARSVGRERVMAAAGSTMENVTMDETTLLPSEVNNNADTKESLSIVTGARSVGREGVMAAAGSTMENVTMDETTLLPSEVNNNADTNESLSNALGFHSLEGQLSSMESDMKSNNDDDFVSESDKSSDDSCWISLGIKDDEKDMMELKNSGLFDGEFWNS